MSQAFTFPSIQKDFEEFSSPVFLSWCLTKQILISLQPQMAGYNEITASIIFQLSGDQSGLEIVHSHLVIWDMDNRFSQTGFTQLQMP